MRATKKTAVILAGFLIAANALSCGIAPVSEVLPIIRSIDIK